MADDSRVTFEEIVGSPVQVDQLYSLLKARSYSISHTALPSFEKHAEFVSAHPYRAWYLVLEDQAAVGSFYLQHDNSIGLNLNAQETHIVDAVLDFVSTNFKPSQAVPSVVPSYFYVNVPFENDWLKRALEERGWTPIQTSFKCADDEV